MLARLALLLALVAALPRVAQADDVVVDEAAEEAFFRGVSMLQAEAYAEALIEFETALNLQPDLRRVHYYKAIAHLRVGDYALARKAADTYSRFTLDEGEARQLEELRAELDAADPGGSEPEEPTPAPEEEEEEDEPEPAGPRMDAEEALAKARRALERNDCAGAVNLADTALRLDPRASGAFVVKGRALLCVGEAARARSILLAYQELHGGRDATMDLEAAKLLEEVEAVIVASAGPAIPASGGRDPAVRIAFGSILAPDRAALERRNDREMVAGVGITRTQRGRFPLAGSRSESTRSWVAERSRLQWVRVRVWGRRGADTPSWFADAFREVYAEIAEAAGAPDASRGLRGARGDAKKALAGYASHDAKWIDEDGDVWRLRLGRCTTPGSRGKAIVENAPCLELLGHTGTWKPRKEEDAAGLAAVRRTEAPGLRLPDFSVSVLGAVPSPTGWIGRDGTGADGSSSPGVALGGGVLARFAFEGLAWGVGYEFSAANVLLFTDTPVFFENRLMFYVGGRLGPRQPSTFDVLFGIGVSPELSGAYPAVGVRLVGTQRTDRHGRFVLSVEPHVVISDTYVTIIPFRLTLGGAVGTTPKPIRQ